MSKGRLPVLVGVDSCFITVTGVIAARDDSFSGLLLNVAHIILA